MIIALTTNEMRDGVPTALDHALIQFGVVKLACFDVFS